MYRITKPVKTDQRNWKYESNKCLHIIFRWTISENKPISQLTYEYWDDTDLLLIFTLSLPRSDEKDKPRLTLTAFFSLITTALLISTQWGRQNRDLLYPGEIEEHNRNWTQDPQLMLVLPSGTSSPPSYTPPAHALCVTTAISTNLRFNQIILLLHLYFANNFPSPSRWRPKCWRGSRASSFQSAFRFSACTMLPAVGMTPNTATSALLASEVPESWLRSFTCVSARPGTSSPSQLFLTPQGFDP